MRFWVALSVLWLFIVCCAASSYQLGFMRGESAMYQEIKNFKEMCSNKYGTLEMVKSCHAFFNYPIIKSRAQ